MEIFKGYIPSRGKAPLYSISTYTPLSNPPKDKDYVGVLKDDIVQVDFDDEVSASIALKIVEKYKLRCDILKTSRGVHLYFINNDTKIKSQKVGVYNAMGLKCDIGLGSKNRVVPLRITKEENVKQIINGQELNTVEFKTTERQWLQKYDVLETIPPYFIPLNIKGYGVDNITARNQGLFNYILVLQSYGFNKDEVRLTCKVINEFMLKEPLSDKELNTITRDEAFSQEIFFDPNGKFLHNVFGNYMLANANLALIDEKLAIYTKDGIYSNNPNDIEREILAKIPSLKDAQRKEVYKYMELQCKNRISASSPRFIGLKNSILDIETMEEFPYSPQFVITNKINYNYNPNAYHRLMDKTLDKVCCGDKAQRALLEEMAGYCLYRKNSLQVCFILTGFGSNGKSTLLNLLKQMLGKENYISLEPREFDQTFKPADLEHKLANFGDDISAKYIEESSTFKKIVTGETFRVERKYGNPFDLECYATQIFCTNNMPRINDTTDGMGRRLVMIPFNAKFSSKDPDYDPFIEDKLTTDEAMEYLIKLAVDGLKRALTNKKFTTSERIEKEKEEFMKINNPVLQFLDDVTNIENNSVGDVYTAYRIWCGNNGYQPLSKINFGKEIKIRTNFISTTRRINGVSTRIYVREGDE